MTIVADGFLDAIDDYDVLVAGRPVRSITELTRVYLVDRSDDVELLLIGEILIGDSRQDENPRTASVPDRVWWGPQPGKRHGNS